MIGDASWLVAILSRWLHLSFACLLVGGTFFMGFLVREGATEGDTPATGSIYLKARRGLKMVVHSSVLFLLLTGTYNATLNWAAYRRNIPLTHALFGTHLLFALIVFAILMVTFARKQPRPTERKWLKIAALLLFLTVLMASSLKYAREHPKAQMIESRP